MATDSKGTAAEAGLSSDYGCEKSCASKIYQKDAISGRPEARKRIPAEFVDTPRLQQPAMHTPFGPPLLSSNCPVSATLPATLSGGRYVSYTPPGPVTAQLSALGSSHTVRTTLTHPSLDPQASIYGAPKLVKSAHTGAGAQSSQSHLFPTHATSWTSSVEGPPLSTPCPLAFPSATTSEYRIITPAYDAAKTTVTRYRLPPSVSSKVLLPIKEVEYCSSLHGSHQPPGIQPSLTTYYLPAKGKLKKRRSAFMGRNRGICERWVLPCLDTLFTAISRACNCDMDIVSPTQYAQHPTCAYQIAGGDAVCLRCGETVDSRLVSAYPLSYKSTRALPAFSTQPTKPPDRGDLIPLPQFSQVEFAEKMREERQVSDPASHAAHIGKRRSSALGYPTDNEGLVALPAFVLSDSK
ncbi:uncharacterized protein LOC113146520 [Cyclospora cayetanensis]|nr:uncharacterized protein LOC113146520 [Cyclospora cayetanensis]